MRSKRTAKLTVILAVLCLVSILGAGCLGQGSQPSADRSPWRLNLPRLHVTYDEQGEPTIFGLSLSTAERWTRSDLSMLRLTPELISQIMGWNVQHVELALSADGVFIFANSKPLPYLGWDAETLANTGALLDRMEVLPSFASGLAPGRRLLPLLLRAMGVGIVLEFPLTAGEQAIPVVNHPYGDPLLVPADAAGESLTLHLGLEYDEAGKPSLEGVPLEQLSELTGQPMAIGTLDGATLDSIRQIKLQSVLLRMEPKGLVPYVDGRPLPYISWSDEQMLNLLDLYQSTDPVDPILGSPQLLDLIRTAVPGLREADLLLSAEFPAQP